MNAANSYIRSRVALIISSCLSLQQAHSISIISGANVLSSEANSLNISEDLLISSTWGFSMNINSKIPYCNIH